MIQVGIAQFLDFCLRVSEANGNALPMLVAHNSRFDNSMLLMSCWQAGIRVPGTWLHLCSLNLAKGVPQVEELGLESKRLGVLAKYFGCVA
jgi:DNA polymerase III epsilon subunit-like protein